ncbi:MAG: NUDIX domain-containing protein [Bacteroidota bacterium]|nr:NUDIX domain-containing protein [Bacteroidota bacterium]
MKLFLNDTRVKLRQINPKLPQNQELNEISISNPLIVKEEIDEIKVISKDTVSFAQIIDYIRTTKFKKVKDFIIYIPDIEQYKLELKNKFKIIKAAGGIVKKADKILLIYRLGNWDLPKGKIEDGEPASDCAIREIEEECGVIAEIDEKFLSTWHSYSEKNKPTLKKTTWYIMNMTNDKKMKPQREENIEDIRWVTIADALKLTEKSYSSIRYVLKKYSKIS